MTTLTVLKQKAASKLKIWTVGQALPSAVNTQMEQAYNETFTELDELGLANWDQDAGEIPDKIADYVADVMAWKRADVYASAEIYARCEQRYSMAERNIRRMQNFEFKPTTEQEDF